MPILTIRHVTTYEYRRPVSFGTHRMMLRPRDDDDQKVLLSDIDIAPAPSELAWTRDAFGNHVAIARFASRAAALRFESTIRVEHDPVFFSADDIAEHAKRYPFAYSRGEQDDIAGFVALQPKDAGVERWARSFLRDDGTADTHDLLVGMTRSIRNTFRHGARHQPGTREPAQTLELKSGACRDLAVLMIAGLHALGIAARFVSGYLNLADPDDDSITGGNTHAWVQAFVPGAGWIDFDPSSGNVGSENLVRLAVAHEPRDTLPLEGTFTGFASDHLAMRVAVKVVAA
jgi:transglutaminase-like putative cysteine protease